MEWGGRGRGEGGQLTGLSNEPGRDSTKLASHVQISEVTTSQPLTHFGKTGAAGRPWTRYHPAAPATASSAAR